ncbi:MAG: hypothetical protein WA957_13575 [Alteraurantiacibacter sp.]
MSIDLPDTYYVALALLGGLGIWAAINFKRAWAPPFLAVLVTFAFWYMVEPLYVPEEFVPFPGVIIRDAYFYGIIFLLSFALVFIAVAPLFRPALGEFGARGAIHRKELARTAEGLAIPLGLLWMMLAAFGTYRVGGDVLQALFPLEGRSGLRMWQRSAGSGAGASGFLVSAASYFYLLVSATFGALLPLAKRRSTRILLVVMICLSWPYLFLQGSRNQTLIAVLPFIASFFIFGRASRWLKILTVLGVGALIFLWFGVVIQMREENVAVTEIALRQDITHYGLNMASELCWMLYFQQNELMQPSWGGRYLAELVNFVPRALWPGKPLIGIDYSVLRGFGGSGSDIGVIATISTGLIGQGIANFGPMLGSICAGFLMALWASFLWRLRVQATLPRLLLFALGLALTINLGRDITLLTLFPFVFGYIAVLAIEYREKRKHSRLRKQGAKTRMMLHQAELDAEIQG